jgi:predicted amino acid racemase
MISVRKIKTFTGTDTRGFNCELLLNGKYVAAVINDGGGGGTHFQWVYREAEKEVLDWAKTQPMPDMSDISDEKWDESKDETGSFRLDVAIEDAIIRKDAEAKIKRLIKKGRTVFLLDDERIDHGYRTLNMPWSDKAKEFLKSKFPGKKLTVLNEALA